MNTSHPLRVVELFAGIGGFRLGLEKSHFRVVWSNQYEPKTKKQHASEVYVARFGKEGHSNTDITLVPNSDIPDHDLLCAGFPCQDYSIANRNNAKGLSGKKGQLWWDIHRIIEDKRPAYLLFENVDRLLSSPKQHKGHDFQTILKSLDKLGYAIEWKIIRADEYGFPQRRKRVYILGYHKTTRLYQELLQHDQGKWFMHDGVFAQSHLSMIQGNTLRIFPLSLPIPCNTKTSPYLHTGVMIEGKVYTAKAKAHYTGSYTVLKDILEKTVDNSFLIHRDELPKWYKMKNARREMKVSKFGKPYLYIQKHRIFPDSIEEPSKTILTSEGGRCADRFKHVIQTHKGLRRLTPIELERLSGFPDNHTKLKGIVDSKRAFFIGNVVIVGIIERIGYVLCTRIIDHIQN